MRFVRLLALLGLVSLLACLSPCTSQAQALEERAGGYPPPMLFDKPPTGIGALVAGAVGIGLGTVNMLTIPLCTADFAPSEYERPCVLSSLIVGGVELGVGLPVLILGLVRHARYNEWKARHRAFVLLEQLDASATEHGASLRYLSRF